MKISGLVVILLLIATAASADIVKWQDADGVTHYTNIPAEVPKDQQANAVVVVDELARRRQTAEAATAAAASAPAEPAHEAQVVYDRSALADVYLEGLERGLESVRGGAPGGSVQINGPLAVASASAPPPSYGYLPPYYSPLVTTSFDRGRSRHLTLRMLLQDQFAIDREGPYTYEGRLDYLPLSVDLNPFLPRGLPHASPRLTRVITR